MTALLTIILIAVIMFILTFVCLAAGSKVDDIIEDRHMRNMRNGSLKDSEEIEKEIGNSF
jgi:hypothetical protein